MNSYRRNDNRGSRGSLAAATALVIFLLLANMISGGALSGMARKLTADLAPAAAHLDPGRFFATRASLAAQAASLQRQLDQLQGIQASYAAAQAQNQALAALVHLAQAKPGVAAPLVSSFTASPYGTFEIGAGSSQGVAAGALVVGPSGYALGKVSQASAGQSLVVSLFAPRASIDGLVDGLPLSLEGDGGGVAEADAPHDAAIKPGDVVVSPSLGQKPIGVVGSVQGSEASASTHVLVRVPDDLETLQYIYVEAGN